MRKALTFLSSCLTLAFAFVMGSSYAQTFTVEVVTDFAGYDVYWEATPVGDPCGTNTIVSAGNTVVGCLGGGAQVATPGDPGALPSNTTVPGTMIGMGAISFDLHEVDDWGDGGSTFNVYADGFLVGSVAANSPGSTTTFDFTAGIPGCTDEDALNYAPVATTDDGSCVIPSCDVDDAVPATPSETGSYCYANNDLVGFRYDADPGQNVTVYFTGGETEATWDVINVYDGTDNTGALLGSFDGAAAGQSFTTISVGGSMYIEFDADGSGDCAGGAIPGPVTWDVYCAVAVVPGCTDGDAVNFNPAATTDDGSCVVPSCDTVDDGIPVAPQDGGSTCYVSGVQETYVYEADPGEQVTLVFTGGATEVGFDDVTVYDGSSAAGTLLGVFEGSLAGLAFSSTSGFLYFEINSDGSVDCDGGAIAGPITWDVYCGTFAGVFGCTTMAALNYDPAATVDDGSCIIPVCVTPALTGNFCYENTTGLGVVFNADVIGDPIVLNIISGIVEAGFDALSFYDGVDNTGALLAGPFEGDVSGIVVEGTGSGNIFMEITADGSVSCASGSFAPIVMDVYCATADTGPGCTDPAALNYDPFASSDDGSCVFPEPNDQCINAIDVACGSTTSGSNINASDAEGLIGSNCGADGGIEGPGVWYRFNGTGDLVTVSTCNQADFDTRLTIFEGPDCNSLSCLTGADDAAGCAAFTTSLQFSSTPGSIYYIYVHGFGGAQGNFDLTVSCEVDPCAGVTPPTNDDCINALPLIDGLPYSEDLCCTNPEQIPTPNFLTFNQTYGIWYLYDNSVLGWDAIDFVFTNTGPAGSIVGNTIYEVIDPLQPICDEANLTAIAGCGEFAGECQAQGFGINSSVYLIHVWTVTPGTCGTMDFSIQGLINGCTDAAADNYDPLATNDDGTCTYTNVPANDECANAIVVNCGDSVAGSTGAATATGSPAACGPAAATGVWYSFIGTGDIVTVSTCGSVIDSRITIVEGPCGAFTGCVGFEDDDPTPAGCGFFDGDDASISFTSTVGTQYYFFISGFGGEEGGFVMDVACEPVTPGCTDSGASNYNPAANVDDGSCDYTFANACGGNYEICYDNFASQVYTYCTPNIGTEAVIITFGPQSIVEAGFDTINIYDGSDNTGTLLFSGDGDISGSTFGAISGCISVEILSDGSVNCADGAFVLGVNFDIACELIVEGCTNPDATNYDPAANVEDGSCQFCGTTISYCYSNNDNYILVLNADPGEQIEIDITNGFFEVGFDTFSVYDGGSIASPVLFTGDGDVSGQTFLSSGNQLTIQITADGSVDCAGLGIGVGQQLEVDVLCGLAGCDNPIACNYDAAAIFLDCGLCEYASCSGCSYPEATNYGGATITLDDGTCIFPDTSCPEDINGDGVINTGDLTTLLGAFGTNC